LVTSSIPTSLPRLAHLLALLAIALLAPPARAQTEEHDNAPIVEHLPPAVFPAGQPVNIRVRVLSPIGKPVQASLHVRLRDLNAFVPVEMKAVPRVPDVFAAQVPAEMLDRVLEYFVEAFDADGNGPGRSATAETPHRVGIGEPVTASAPPISATTPSAAQPLPAVAPVVEAPRPGVASVPPIARESAGPVATPVPPPSEPAQVPAAALVAADPFLSPVAGRVLIGLGAAATLAGGVLAGLALVTSSGDTTHTFEGRTFHSTTQAAAAGANSQATAGIVLGGLGAALAVVGFFGSW
jgi:hypothetical protein